MQRNSQTVSVCVCIGAKMSLPYLARSTATHVVKRNIRFSEVAACQEPSRIAWRASRIIARHTRDRARERLVDPERFDRCPALVERAIRRSPPPVCAYDAASSLSCPGDADHVEAANGNEQYSTDTHDKVDIREKNENEINLRNKTIIELSTDLHACINLAVKVKVKSLFDL